MANTYFKMKVEEKESMQDASPKIALTAFVGGSKSIQLTLNPMANKNAGYGYSYILLSDEEAIRLAKALIERVDKKISATDERKSEYTDEEELEELEELEEN